MSKTQEQSVVLRINRCNLDDLHRPGQSKDAVIAFGQTPTSGPSILLSLWPIAYTRDSGRPPVTSSLSRDLCWTVGRDVSGG